MICFVPTKRQNRFENYPQNRQKDKHIMKTIKQIEAEIASLDRENEDSHNDHAIEVLLYEKETLLKTLGNKTQSIKSQALKLAHAMHLRKEFNSFGACLKAAYAMLQNNQVIALADKLMLAYSSYTAALVAAYRSIFDVNAKRRIMHGLSNAAHLCGKLGLKEESYQLAKAYSALFCLPVIPALR